MQKKQAQLNMRDSNIELYRIISMLLIIAHHYVVNSGLFTASGAIFSAPTSFRSLFLLILGGFGKIGINCFVLITGYFMCRSNISAKKFAKLFFELMFYKIIINCIFWLTGYTQFTIRSFINSLIPFSVVADNFTGTYLIFFLCIPFLNILVHNLTEKQHIRLTLLAVFTYVFFETIPTFMVSKNYVSWYIVLFLTASYIRLYPKKIFSSTKFWGAATAVCFILCCASIVVCAKIGRSTYYFVTDSNTLLAFLTGISSFLFFKNWNIKNSKLINTVSATTFGVLMIHAHSDTMRQWLWVDVLHNVEMYNSPWIYVHAISSVIIIFAVCSVIDMLRIRFVEKPFFNLWDRYFGRVSAAYASFESKLCEKLGIDN